MIENVVKEVTCNDQLQKEDPIIKKLALYVIAHRNYLQTLNFQEMRDNKINWGLKKVHKIGEQTFTS